VVTAFSKALPRYPTPEFRTPRDSSAHHPSDIAAVRPTQAVVDLPKLSITERTVSSATMRPVTKITLSIYLLHKVDRIISGESIVSGKSRSDSLWQPSDRNVCFTEERADNRRIEILGQFNNIHNLHLSA
jgi:hypothetical protein